MDDNDTFTDENTVTRVASGAYCSGKGYCRVSGGLLRPVLHTPVSHRGERMKKSCWQKTSVSMMCEN